MFPLRRVVGVDPSTDIDWAKVGLVMKLEARVIPPTICHVGRNGDTTLEKSLCWLSINVSYSEILENEKTFG